MPIGFFKAVVFNVRSKTDQQIHFGGPPKYYLVTFRAKTNSFGCFRDFTGDKLLFYKFFKDIC